MRISFLTFTVVALVASTMTAASAFNYATTSRTVGSAIVTDNGAAYLSITAVDADHDCFVAYTSGKVDVTFDAGDGTCSASMGSGAGTDSLYYYTDVIQITNKGSKPLTGLWLNMTDTVITIKTATAPGMAADTAGWAQTATHGALAIGDSIYVGFKVDTTGLTSAQTKSLSIAARATN